MRTIIVLSFVSLNGVMQTPGGQIKDIKGVVESKSTPTRALAFHVCV